MIDIERINALFKENIGKHQINMEGKCSCCGCDVKISIERTTGGYGFLGGSLYETEEGQLLSVCINCQKKGKSIRKSAGNCIMKIV